MKPQQYAWCGSVQSQDPGIYKGNNPNPSSRLSIFDVRSNLLYFATKLFRRAST